MFASGLVVTLSGFKVADVCAQGGETRFVSKVNRERLKDAIFDYFFFVLPSMFAGSVVAELNISVSDVFSYAVNENNGLTGWINSAEYEVSKDENNRGHHLWHGGELPTEDELYYNLAEFYFINSFLDYLHKNKNSVINGLSKIDVKIKEEAESVCKKCYSTLKNALFYF